MCLFYSAFEFSCINRLLIEIGSYLWEKLKINILWHLQYGQAQEKLKM